MEKSSLDLLKEYRNIVEGRGTESPVYRSVMRRLEFSHPEIFTQYGYDVVENAVLDQSSFVGDVEEIGSSDVSIWTHRVIDELKRDEFGAGVA